MVQNNLSFVRLFFSFSSEHFMSNTCTLSIMYNEWTTHFFKVWSLLEIISLSICASFLIEGVHMSSDAGKVNTSKKKNQTNLSESLVFFSLMNAYCLIFIGNKRLIRKVLMKNTKLIRMRCVYCGISRVNRKVNLSLKTIETWIVHYASFCLDIILNS